MLTKLFNRLRGPLIVFALTLGLAAPGLAAPAANRANTAVYARTLTGTGFVIMNEESGNPGRATCWVVDRDRRLVVTNEHVVSFGGSIQVHFPLYSQNKLLTAWPSYQQYGKPIPGKVLARDRNRDLALVQLSWLPQGVQALPLAPRSVTAGETVHSVGNSGANMGTLWRYRQGKVLRVAFDTKVFANSVVHRAHFITTDEMKTPGDSGGPLVNDAGQVVGVVNGFNPMLGVGFSIDLEDLRQFLDEVSPSPSPGPAPRPLASGVVGTWRAAYMKDGLEQAVSLIFREDGRCELRGLNTIPGSYTYTDGVLTIELSGTSREALRLEWNGPDRFSFRSGDVVLVCTRQ
jgi:S1-C subfamily serine protease